MRLIITLLFLLSGLPATSMAEQGSEPPGAPAVEADGGERGGEESEARKLRQGKSGAEGGGDDEPADESAGATEPVDEAGTLAVEESLRGPTVPGGAEVIFGGIVSPSELASTASGLEAMLVTRLEEMGKARILRTWDLGRLLDNQAQRLIAGCTEDCEDMIDILGALGAPRLLVGELHTVGGTFFLTLTMLDTDTARVLARSSAEGGSKRALLRGLRSVAWSLLEETDLVRPELGPHGFGMPRLHLSLKGGNSLAAIGWTELDELGEALRGTLHGGRFNLEVSYYVRSSVLIFAEVGAGWGRARDQEQDSVLDLDIVPVGLGVKRLWPFPRCRLWAGGMLGAGFLGMFVGGSNDLATALATTAVAGVDWRLGARWTILLEASTSVTDALLRGADEQDVTMPVHAGLNLGVSRLF